MTPTRKEAPHFSDFDFERFYRRLFIKDSEIEKMERHLAECSTCRKRLQEAARYVETLRSITGRGDHEQEID